MFGSDILDAAIGLFFVYLLFSVVCSALNEWIIGYLLQWRARTLERALARLLGSEAMAAQFFKQPLIQSLATDGQKRLSYLSPARFVDGLLSLVGSAPEDASAAPGSNLAVVAQDPQKLLDNLAHLGELPLHNVLKSLLAGVRDLETARSRLESWFNEGMEHASGWYKRHVQICLLVLAVAVTALWNVNTFTIVRGLLTDAKLRAALAAAAQESVQAAHTSGTNTAPQWTVGEIQSQIQTLGLPIGWGSRTNLVMSNGQQVQAVTWAGSDEGWLMRIGGLLVTAAAVSLGAPFWFDLLNKAVNLRATGKKPSSERNAPKV